MGGMAGVVDWACEDIAMNDSTGFVKLGEHSFRVKRAVLSRISGEKSDYCWNIEIECGLDTTEIPEDGDEPPWYVGTEPSLYAQILPLRASHPDELIGREFSFPQTPDDDPADWPEGIGWPFFVLYAWEHDLVYPSRVMFLEGDGGRYRVRILSEHACGPTPIVVEAWLAFE